METGATVVTCQQGMLVLPSIWFRPIWGLVSEQVFLKLPLFSRLFISYISFSILLDFPLNAVSVHYVKFVLELDLNF